MEDQELVELARICRSQAAMASTPRARRVLIELARQYEASKTDASLPECREAAGEESQ